jgi:hypothetical protein
MSFEGEVIWPKPLTFSGLTSRPDQRSVKVEQASFLTRSDLLNQVSSSGILFVTWAGFFEMLVNPADRAF